MKVSDRVLIAIRALGPNHPQTTTTLLVEEFSSLFATQISPDRIRSCVEELIEHALVKKTDGSLVLTLGGREKSYDAMIEYGASEGYRTSLASAADQEYLSTVRKESGIVGLTEKSQQQFLSETLVRFQDPVLDVGCGDGVLTDFLHKSTGLTFVGIDRSEDIIGAAASRYPEITFRVHDMDSAQRVNEPYGSAISIDSMYFSTDPDSTLGSLVESLDDHGCLVVAYSQYRRDDEGPACLLPESNPIGRFVNRSEVRAEIEDFTQIERSVWETKLQALERLKAHYYEQRAGYLYLERHNEARAVGNICADHRNARYVYVIKR